MEGAQQDGFARVAYAQEQQERETLHMAELEPWMIEDDLEATDFEEVEYDALSVRSLPEMGDIYVSELLPRQQASELATLNNFSTRQYDKYVYSLSWQRTGCYRKGGLPVPLATNDTCLPGWYCRSTYDKNGVCKDD